MGMLGCPSAPVIGESVMMFHDMAVHVDLMRLHYLCVAALGCPHEGRVSCLPIPGIDVKDETVSVLE